MQSAEGGAGWGGEVGVGRLRGMACVDLGFGFDEVVGDEGDGGVELGELQAELVGDPIGA